MAAAAPMTQKARLVVALAIAGAIPLTGGVLIWVIGSVMGAAFHGGWAGVASTGRVTALAGLLLGLVMIVLAASGRREAMRARPRRPARSQPGTTPSPLPQNLLPVAPEHQAILADPPPMEQVPPAGMAYPPGEHLVEQVPPSGMAFPPPGEQRPVEQARPPGMAFPLAGEQGPPPGMPYPPGEQMVERVRPPGMAFPPSGERLAAVEQGPPWGMALPPPGEMHPESGPGYPLPQEPYPPGRPAPPPAGGTYPPAKQPWPVSGTFGTGGPPDGRPYSVDPALPPYPAQPDDTYPRFPAYPGPFAVSPEPPGPGQQPGPGHPPPDHGGPPSAGDDYPGFHRERGFPVPPESRGEGGYRRLAAPEEWW